MKATETSGATKVDTPHTTFIPHSHPFAHARLLNVVVRASFLPPNPPTHSQPTVAHSNRLDILFLSST